MVFEEQSRAPLKPGGSSSETEHGPLQVEPDRWYFHADRLGMLVWQDMPCMCGMLNTSWGNNWYPECSNAERPITEESK